MKPPGPPSSSCGLLHCHTAVTCTVSTFYSCPADGSQCYLVVFTCLSLMNESCPIHVLSWSLYLETQCTAGGRKVKNNRWMKNNSSSSNKELQLETPRESWECAENAMFHRWSKWHRRSRATGVTESGYFWNNEPKLELSGEDEKGSKAPTGTVASHCLPLRVPQSPGLNTRACCLWPCFRLWNYDVISKDRCFLPLMRLPSFLGFQILFFYKIKSTLAVAFPPNGLPTAADNWCSIITSYKCKLLLIKPQKLKNTHFIT